jgi:hypothetical protein
MDILENSVARQEAADFYPYVNGRKENGLIIKMN